MNKLSLRRKRLHKKSLSANQILRKVYGSSKNFMTPHVIEVGKLRKDTAYELSSGEFLGDSLYGVSIATKKGGKYTKSDASKSFHSISEARDYIGLLKKKDMHTPQIVKGRNEKFSLIKKSGENNA